MINEYKILAVCVSEIQSEDTQRFIDSVYRLFSGYGWKIVIYNSSTELSHSKSFNKGEACVYSLINYDVTDAVIIYGEGLYGMKRVNEVISKSVALKIPVILVGSKDERNGCVSIAFDGCEVFRQLVTHLVRDHKYTRINCIAGYKDDPESEWKLNILREVLSENGVPFDEQTQLGYGNSYSVSTRKVLRSFIRNRDKLPEAIVCLDDTMAITACEYLVDNGIDIPGEITVTGYGGSEHEQYCFPRITTCRCDMESLAEFIYDKMCSMSICGDSVIFPYTLDKSQSCGCKKIESTNVLKSINRVYSLMSGSTRYDRSMNHMLTRLTGELDKETITKKLKRYSQFDAFLCINTDFCSDVKVKHTYANNPFTEYMDSYGFLYGEEEVFEERFKRDMIIPDTEMLLSRNEPMIIFTIHNRESVYGYMAAFAGDLKPSVYRMQRFIMCLSSCVSMYEQQYYMIQSNKQLQQIQSEIIHSFADLVESRDGSTGKHIKRTGEYVKVLVEYLSAMPQYEKELTPEMKNRICAAAPLHDIGKIKISDIILNKPERLTADEFEVIKTHTIEGSEIITKTLTNIENEEYLKIANEMALYHHEKWDGTGYLYHLSGEDIPLCARIMAVVDVFDALTSKRVYKDAFSFEEAIGIICESRGTHFDPTIIDAFMSILDDIKRIFIENADTE